MLQKWSRLLELILELLKEKESTEVMKNKSHPKDFLRRKLEELKMKNPRLSLRSLAQKIGLSSGALSEVLSGKRELSLKARQKIAEKLLLSPDEKREFFEDLLPMENIKVSESEPYQLLSQDQFSLISDWWHFAILNLFYTKNFRGSYQWISERLGISLKVVEEAWDRLMRLGYIKKSGHRLIRAYPKINTQDGLFDLSLQKSHIEDLKLIEESVRHLEVSQRDVCSLSLAVRREDFSRAVQLIRKFQDEFMEALETKEGDDVYRLSIAYFPLTKVDNLVRSPQRSRKFEEVQNEV